MIKVKLIPPAILSSILFFLLGSLSYGQSDSLTTINDLHFHSDFEKEMFESVLNGSSEDYLALYLSIDSTVDKEECQAIKESIKSKTAQYHSPSFSKLKESKKVKKIYKEVHDQFLVKYSEAALFSTTIHDGTYQCVSGTMLYALIFDDLKIPFEIKLLPDHVYIIAYPRSHFIMVETTSPSRGTFVFDQQFKEQYVKFLADNKIISREEFEIQSTGELFDKYFNEPEVIDMKQLASAQYSNMALDFIMNIQFKQAFRLMEKAYILRPSQKNSYILFLTLAGTLEQTPINSEDFASYLGKYIRFQKINLNTDQIFALFSQMTFKQLEYDGNVELYDKSYHKVISYVRDSALKSEMAFLYNFERGRKLYNKGNYREARVFVNTAYSIKPANSDTEMMMLGILSDRIEKGLYDREEEKLMDIMDSYVNEFPQLNENVNFKSMRLLLCLTLMDRLYYNGNITGGEKYRIKFEEIYPERDYNFLDLNGEIVHSYNTAASYYFRKGNYKKSREMLRKGLHYAPNNYLLMQRLDMMN